MLANSDEVLRKYYAKNIFVAEWSKDVTDFLTLLRLLPFKPGAKSTTTTEVFKNGVKRLLVFSDV